MADLNELLVIELDAVANPPLWTGRYNVYLQLDYPEAVGEYGWAPGEVEAWGLIQTATRVLFYRYDADGVEAVPAGRSAIALDVVPTLTFRASWTRLAQSIEWGVLRMEGWRDFEGSEFAEITFDRGAPMTTGGNVTPDRADTVQFTLKVGSSVPTTRKAWTYRRDFRPTDAFLAPSAGVVAIETDAIFRVRYDALWTPGRAFAYRGSNWTTLGSARVRRLALLDILARRTETA